MRCNILLLIWTYVIKKDGTKKACCIYNGSPHQKSTVALGNTYPASLEQSGSRLFWTLSALMNCKVYGADATNTFAEAPPPLAPLYVKIDNAYRNWHSKYRKLKPIPQHYILPVRQALQGHSESPRLWAKYIYKILTKLNSTS